MTLSEIIKEKLSRLESVPDAFLSSLQKVEKDFLKEVLILVSRLEVKNGNIQRNQKNLVLLSEIESSLKNSFFEKTEYLKSVTEFIGEFNTQSLLTNDYFKKAFEKSTIPDIAKQVLEIKKRSTLNLLLGAKLEADFINPLYSIVDLGATSGASYSETLSAIQDIITGNSQIDSKLHTYAKQITHDTFAVSDRAYTKVVSDELKAEWFQYAGGIISGSREFCIARHNKFYHKIEIEKWAAKDWAGKMDGTNAQTIFETAGGHRCRHSILPKSIFSIPKEVVQRNIDSGNYKPSKVEVEEIGL